MHRLHLLDGRNQFVCGRCRRGHGQRRDRHRADQRHADAAPQQAIDLNPLHETPIVSSRRASQPGICGASATARDSAARSRMRAAVEHPARKPSKPRCVSRSLAARLISPRRYPRRTYHKVIHGYLQAVISDWLRKQPPNGIWAIAWATVAMPRPGAPPHPSAKSAPRSASELSLR